MLASEVKTMETRNGNRILVYGAGVLGSLYAARLAESGKDVTILARGQRLRELWEHGIVLEDARVGGPGHSPPQMDRTHFATSRFFCSHNPQHGRLA